MAQAPPYARSSLTAKLCLHGDPTWAAYTGPVLAWIDECWRTFGGAEGNHHLRLPRLQEMWTVAEPNLIRTWAQCRGPVQIAGCVLHKLGWKWQEPFAMTADAGEELRLSVHSPALMGWQLQAAVQRMHGRSLGARIASEFHDRPDIAEIDAHAAVE